MNNRILATLLALVMVFALFIGVAPVEAEAASVCKHVDKNNDCVCDKCEDSMHAGKWQKDSEKHWMNCTKCNTPINALAEHNYAGTYKSAANGKHTATCKDCGYQKTEAHVRKDDECRCSLCNTKMDCEFETKFDDTYHWQQCKFCGAQKDKVEHKPTRTPNGDGTHKTVYTCGKPTVFDAACVDGTDDNCLCDLCGGATSNHQLKKVERKNATCEEDGHYGYYQCLFCDKFFNGSDKTQEISWENLVIKHEGHKPNSDWQYDENQHWYICYVCKEDKTDLGNHDFVYTSNGEYSHTGVCSVCKQSVPSTFQQPHVDANNDCVCDAPGCEHLMHETSFKKAKEKTCTEAGWKDHHECSKCGGKFYDLNTYEVVDPSIPASHDPVSTIKYNDEGHYQYCRDCKQNINFQAHTLKYERYDAEKCKISCTFKHENGNECDFVKYPKHVDANKDCICDTCKKGLDHDYVARGYIAPDCFNEGRKAHYECSVCKGLFDYNDWTIKLDNIVIEPTGHKWDVQGSTSVGKHSVKCSVCAECQIIDHYSKDGDCFCDIAGCNKAVHSHALVTVKKVAPSCTTAGTEAYKYYKGCGKMFDMSGAVITAPKSIPAVGHMEGNWVGADNGREHVKKCMECGVVLASAAHTPSATNSAVCSICNASIGLEEVARREPTCTDVGYEKYWVSPTGATFLDAAGTRPGSPVQIPAKGHTYTYAGNENSNTHTGTCTDCGHTRNENCTGTCVCTVCNFELLGHDRVEDPGKLATCVSDGYVGYSYCPACKLYYNVDGTTTNAVKVIPMTGHNMTGVFQNYVARGYHNQRCQNVLCNEIITAEHEWSDAEDTLKGNVHQMICECGAVKTGIHYDSNDGDKACDECGHDMSGTSVEVQKNNSETIIVNGGSNAAEKDKADNAFGGYVGEGETSGGSASNGSASKGNSVATKPTVPATGNGNRNPVGNNADSTPAAAENNAPAATQKAPTAAAPAVTAPSVSNTDVSGIAGFFQWLASWLNVWFG